MQNCAYYLIFRLAKMGVSPFNDEDIVMAMNNTSSQYGVEDNLDDVDDSRQYLNDDGGEGQQTIVEQNVDDETIVRGILLIKPLMYGCKTYNKSLLMNLIFVAFWIGEPQKSARHDQKVEGTLHNLTSQ